MKDFAERLKEAMRDKGLVAKKGAASGLDAGSLATVAGVSLEMARRYIDGLAVPRRAKMELIADYLDVNLMWLRDGLGPKNGDPVLALKPHEHTILRKIRRLDDQGVKWVIHAIDAELLATEQRKKS